LVLASLLLLAAATELPPSERPPSFTESLTWEARIDAPDPTRPLAMGRLQVSLQSTRLAQVRAAVGSGTIFHDGDAGGSLHWLCYYSADEGEVLWLSSGELGGGDVIDGVTLRALPTGSAPPRGCNALPRNYRPLLFDGGVSLGSSEAEVRKVYGEPEPLGDVWVYAFSGKNGRFDVDASACFRMIGGKVAGVELHRVSSD
jgi:hypothetical protein